MEKLLQYNNNMSLYLYTVMITRMEYVQHTNNAKMSIRKKSQLPQLIGSIKTP